jgi:hypothetical protein
MQEYKYDVAISFLAQDEPLATQITSILQDRLKVFLYSQEQKRLAGKDGERAFNEVFSKEARAVVILYRQEWGESPWTRIEETAIRNRAFEHGFDFALFVALEDKTKLPEYVPKNRLWIGLSRFGVHGAASVIDARIQELGGEPKAPSLEERAAYAQSMAEFKAFRARYLKSPAGISTAESSFNELLQRFAQRIPAIQLKAPVLGLEAKFYQHMSMMVVLSSGSALKIAWHRQCSNSLDGAYIDATTWNGHPPIPGLFAPGLNARPQKIRRLAPELIPGNHFLWKIESSEPPEYLNVDGTCEQILNWWLDESIGFLSQPL